MEKKFNPEKFKLVGLALEDFHKAIKEKDIFVREARLIPVHKVGDELALASVFLASLKYVKEYREKFFKAIKFKKSSQLLF